MLTEGEKQKSVRNSKTGDFEPDFFPAPLPVGTVAKWLDCSDENVQSIESGRVNLTREKAELFSNQTATHTGWLLGRNPANPIDWYTRPYTPTAFKERQAELKRRKNDRKFAAHLVQVNFAKATAILAAILLRAFQDGKDDIVALKVTDTLRDLYFDADKTGVDRNGLVGSFMAGRHKTTRPDLKPTLDAWEAHFQKMLPKQPQPKAWPAKRKVGRHKADKQGLTASSVSA
jgi:hypothetical protein